jgi:hypothetical protein
MTASALLDRLRETATPIDRVRAPTVAGVYAWFLDEPSALPTLPDQGRDPIYVGMSSNLSERGDETHFRSGESGFSTLRRSLGAVLKDELRLSPEPRGTGSSRQNYRCYRFDDAGEERITAWMRSHLRVGIAAVDSPETVETDLILLAQPPLNLTKWANPYRAEIKALRKACADEALRNFPR